jgi:hypothetical protein
MLIFLIQYTSELNRIQLENGDLNLNLIKRAQEDRRDRLIDSASPEPRVVVYEDGEEIMEMTVKQVKERRRQLRGQLEQIGAGMDALKTEMDWVEMEVKALGH